jgi:hypothetical protein
VDQRYLVASGNEGSATDTISFGALLPEENNITVGVVEDLSAGINYKIQVLNLEGDYRVNTNSYLETGLIQTGTKQTPRTFRYFEVVLGKELISGEAVTLYYRVNLTDGYTTIGSISYTTDGAVHSKIIENSGVNGDQIQFKAIITCASSATTSPELKAIYLY